MLLSTHTHVYVRGSNDLSWNDKGSCEGEGLQTVLSMQKLVGRRGLRCGALLPSPPISEIHVQCWVALTIRIFHLTVLFNPIK